jgi:hypothetical protein
MGGQDRTVGTRHDSWLVLRALVLTTLGCGEDSRSVGVFDVGDSSGSLSSTASATMSASGATSAASDDADTSASTDAPTTESSASEDDGPILDVGNGMDTIGGCAEGEDCGCTAVDVLFVIDNSGSMCLKQENLAAAFPGFVDAMATALPEGTDLHVGITTSGFALGGSHSENNCIPQETQETIDEYYVRPGEGMVAGNGLQGRLFEHDGMSYFAVGTADDAGMAELKTWFSAAATAVGCGVSSFEFNASGAAWALHPDNAATNDGFIRDEGAALLLFVLSDEADQSLDVEELAFLHDTVVAAKSECGGDDCIVSGGLFSIFCTPANNAAHQFLSSFGEEPIWGDIGLGIGPPPDYAGIVGDALAQIVAEQCEQITPEG